MPMQRKNKQIQNFTPVCFFFCINSFILTPYIQLASVVFLIDILVDQKSLKDFSIPTESTVSLKTDVIKNMLDVASL